MSAKKTPYIGFTNETLIELPPVKPGDLVLCNGCTEKHPLLPADDGSTLLMFYKCPTTGNAYLGAVDGHSIARTKADVSGEVSL